MKAFIILFPFLFVSCVFSDPEDFNFRGREKTKSRPRANVNKVDDSDQTEANQVETNRAKAPVTDKTTQTNNQAETDTTPASADTAPALSKDNEDISFVFPIEITNDLKSLKLESKDNKRIHISSTDGEMFVLAPQTGSLAINSIKNQYHLEISMGEGRSLNLLFDKTKTSLKVDSKTQVTQEQLIAQTSSPITFYISKAGEELILCFGDISDDIPIIKDLKDIEAC